MEAFTYAKKPLHQTTSYMNGHGSLICGYIGQHGDTLPRMGMVKIASVGHCALHAVARENLRNRGLFPMYDRYRYMIDESGHQLLRSGSAGATRGSRPRIPTAMDGPDADPRRGKGVNNPLE